MRVEEGLYLSPAGESDVVVGGDTSNNHTFQDQRKCSTNSAALSVGQPLYPHTLRESVYHDQEYPRRALGYNEVHLQMTYTIERRPLVDVHTPIVRHTVVVFLSATFAFVPAPEEVLLKTTTLGEFVDSFCRARDAVLPFEIPADLFW